MPAVFSQTNREVHFQIEAEHDLPQSESRRGLSPEVEQEQGFPPSEKRAKASARPRNDRTARGFAKRSGGFKP